MKKRTFCKMIVGAALAIGLSGAAYADDVLAKVKADGVRAVRLHRRRRACRPERRSVRRNR
jgi:hypothetical protein